MRVLHFVPGSGVGGIERFVMDVTSIANDEIEYEYIVFARKKSTFIDCISERGKVHICTGWSLGTLKKTYRIMKNGRYDVVHAHLGCWSFIILLLAFVCGIKKRIAHAHSADGFKNMNTVGKIMFLSSRLMNPICVNQFCACSDHACEVTFGRKITKSSRYTKILNPVDFNRFGAFSEEKSSSIRKELGIQEGSRVVCNVGFLGKHKNQQYLLELATNNALKNCSILLVGEGYGRKDFEVFIQNEGLKNIYLTGVRNDIPDILRMADVFVLPSLLEGLGTVVLEAQACGTPCIVSENVTLETDMGIGLVQQIPLKDKDAWVLAISSASKQLPSQERILKSFVANKVELRACVDLLASIYKGCGL